MCVCVTASYLGGAIGVDGDHVLGALFDLELNVELAFQGGNAVRRPALRPRGLRRVIWGGEGGGLKVKTRNRSRLKTPRRGLYDQV